MTVKEKIAAWVLSILIVSILIYLYWQSKINAAKLAVNNTALKAQSLGINSTLTPVSIPHIAAAASQRAATITATGTVKATSLSSLLSAASGAPAAPTTAQISATQRAISTNNYVIWTYGIIKALNDTGNIDIATNLQNQLITAYNNGNAVPVFDTISAKATFGTLSLPTGGALFAQPAIIGGVSGWVDSTGYGKMLAQVYANACTILCITAKNLIQENTHGQAIGQRQGLVMNIYNDCLSGKDNINVIPQQASYLLTNYYYAAGKLPWPAGYGGGQPPSEDLNIVIGDVIKVVGTIVAIIIACVG